MEKHEQVHRDLKKMLYHNFLGGMAWAVGLWVGTTIIVTLMVFVISKVNLVPIVGDFVVETAEYIENTTSGFNNR